MFLNGFLANRDPFCLDLFSHYPSSGHIGSPGINFMNSYFCPKRVGKNVLPSNIEQLTIKNNT
jgi:hypothetical protein